MNQTTLKEYSIDYIEIFTPMAKALAYWHTHALGFQLFAFSDAESGKLGVASYVLKSNDITLVLTSTYPVRNIAGNDEITSFIATNYCGVKKLVLKVDSVQETFENSIKNGAFPLLFPLKTEDDKGFVEEAAIKLYDNSEIVFVNRESYKGVFKPGYQSARNKTIPKPVFSVIDHIASEVRINESAYWTDYLNKVIGVDLVQSIDRASENKTGMILKINQSFDKNLTLVIAEPETYARKSKVQDNIDIFGPGIHHLAFATNDLLQAVRELTDRDVEFVNFPASYYDLLRKNPDFRDTDIDLLQQWGILIDKEDDTYLLQKFIKPISDRPFFFYELVQRVNGYNGFALKNINVLKKAEEMEISKI